MDDYKRYDKFKNNTLVTPFYDEEREVLKFVWNLNGELKVRDTISEFMESTTNVSLYYPYVGKDNDSIIHFHAHSFEELLRVLYSCPETFKILKKDEIFYSKQQLKYLNRVKKYLLFLGLRDDNNEGNKRYQNEIIKKYSKCYIYTIDKKEKELIKKGKLDFLWWNYHSYINYKDYEPSQFQALLVDEKDNFLYFIEFIDSRVVKYKDIKNIVKIDKKKDNNKVVIRHFKILERF